MVAEALKLMISQHFSKNLRKLDVLLMDCCIRACLIFVLTCVFYVPILKPKTHAYDSLSYDSQVPPLTHTGSGPSAQSCVSPLCIHIHNSCVLRKETSPATLEIE